jgi:hypothetical protein
MDSILLASRRESGVNFLVKAFSQRRYCDHSIVSIHSVLQESAWSNEMVPLPYVSMDTYGNGIILCICIRIIYLHVLMGVYDILIPLVEVVGSISL